MPPQLTQESSLTTPQVCFPPSAQCQGSERLMSNLPGAASTDLQICCKSGFDIRASTCREVSGMWEGRACDRCLLLPQMELIHEDESEDRREVAAILQEEFGILAEQAPLDVRLQVCSGKQIL